MTSIFRTALSAIVIATAMSAAGAAQSQTVTCDLAASDGGFSGTCSVPCAVNALAINIDGPRSGFSCSLPDRQVDATLKPQPQFDDWLGTMQGKEPEDPVRFSVIKPKDGKEGVAKTPYGWFAVTKSEQIGDKLQLTISANRQLPPTEEDLRIIRRALALLPSEAVWNKQDDRKCPAGQERLSLFCAMTQATTEVSGGVHYRQSAMQAVREVLNEVGGDRVKKHRIMDYNNHPDTTLADIHALLRAAESKLTQRLN
jgi:hypothetical protein